MRLLDFWGSAIETRYHIGQTWRAGAVWQQHCANVLFHLLHPPSSLPLVITRTQPAAAEGGILNPIDVS